MFVGEYLLRYRLHPEFERATLGAGGARLLRDRGAAMTERRGADRARATSTRRSPGATAGALARRQFLADVAALAERLPARRRDAQPLRRPLPLRGRPRRRAAARPDQPAAAEPPSPTRSRGCARASPAPTRSSRPRRDDARPAERFATRRARHAGARRRRDPARSIADLVAAHVLTSGSTGAPVPHAKPWGLLVAQRARPRRAGSPTRSAAPTSPASTLVATVPAQHMYGFESSVLLALLGGAAFDAGGRSIPADIAAALARVAAPRALVTTPFHLKTLLDAGRRAAAGRPASSAPPRRCRRSWRRAPKRRSARRWSRSTAAPRPARSRRGARPRAPSGSTFDGLRLDGDGDRSRASAAATCRSRRALADVLEVVDAETLPPARPLQRPDQRRRQAQLARPPELPPQRDRRRRRRRVLDAARATTATPASSAWSPSSSRPALRASAIVAALREPRRRGVPAAPRRPRRRAAARGDRQADRARGSRELAARARSPRGRAMSETIVGVAQRSTIARRPSGLRRPLPRPAGAARRRAARRGAGGGAAPSRRWPPASAPRRAWRSSSSSRRSARARRSRSRLRARRRARSNGASASAAATSPAARSRAPTSPRRRRHEGRRRHRAAARAGPRQRERSNLLALRVMRWIALAAGRRVARLAAASDRAATSCSSTARRAATRRATSRARSAARATWRDVYRHFHTFAPTVLDRVYLLRERFDLFDASRPAASRRSSSRSAAARACWPVGAHLGSFEALRAVGHEQGPARGDGHVRGQRAADQRHARGDRARAPSCTPSRSAASTRCSSLRHWLDDGGLAGLLADRTLPGAIRSARRRVALPFLGAPARFTDGPFRLAALLRRTVVFMAGLYRGGNRYDLRFDELADFSDRGRRRRGERDALIARPLQRYVAHARSAVPRGAVQLVQLLRLLGRCRRRSPQPRPERRRCVAAPSRCWPALARRAGAARRGAGVRPRRS